MWNLESYRAVSSYESGLLLAEEVHVAFADGRACIKSHLCVVVVDPVGRFVLLSCMADVMACMNA